MVVGTSQCGQGQDWDIPTKLRGGSKINLDGLFEAIYNYLSSHEQVALPLHPAGS